LRRIDSGAREGPVAEADAVFIAVGTPSRRGDGHADLSYVHVAAREVAGAVSGFTVVVTKSTVPVGTGHEVERIIAETNPGADVAVVSDAESLREGAAIQDFRAKNTLRDADAALVEAAFVSQMAELAGPGRAELMAALRASVELGTGKEPARSSEVLPAGSGRCKKKPREQAPPAPPPPLPCRRSPRCLR
jgi:hypothetical protein